MARSIFVNGWNIPIRLEDFNFIESARNGEVGMGGFNLDSENAGVTINSHWDVSARETSAPAPNYLYEGYVADLTIARGPFSIDKDRQYDVNIVDLNTLLIDDIITGASGNRPEETDIARVTWLTGTSFLSGMGATIGASGATTLEAADFRTQTPLDLLTQAAETAGKLFFVYWDFATEAPKLFYDLATASNFITSSKISTYLPDGSNSTTHHPRKASLVRGLDGGRIYSELLFKYDGGSVTVTNAATASNYRARKTVIYDNFVKSSAQATRKANQYLNSVATPEDVITLEVDLTAAQINEFRAGQLMQIKAPHLGLPTFVDRRIVRTERKPRVASGPPDQEDYTVTMELSVPKSNKFGSSGVPLEVLPDEVANPPTPTEPITRTCAGGGTANQHAMEVTDREGELVYGGGGSGIGSYISQNTAYYAAGCPLGGGGWDGATTDDQWYEFTAPADTESVGLTFTIPASGYYFAGPVQADWVVKIVDHGYASGRQGEGIIVATGDVGADFDVFVDRSLIKWGTTMCLAIAPTRRIADCGKYMCNGATYYGNPTGDGRAGSWQMLGFGTGLNYDVCTFDTGSGLSNWVGGVGAINGLNTTFRLISWDGTGDPQARMNGIDLTVVETDTVALTVTVASAPSYGDLLTFQYNVVQA